MFTMITKRTSYKHNLSQYFANSKDFCKWPSLFKTASNEKSKKADSSAEAKTNNSIQLINLQKNNTIQSEHNLDASW